MNHESLVLIEKLGVQCTSFHFDPRATGSVTVFDKEQFTELLIMECVGHILNSSDRHRKEYFAESLLEKFGLKT